VAENRPGVVYIDPEEPEGNSGLYGGPGVTATWEVEQGGPKYVEAVFRTFEDAIAWGRERSPRVLVRLGAGDETHYSAGEKLLTRDLPEDSGPDVRSYATWPPPGWTPRQVTINPPLYEAETDLSRPRAVDELRERFPELYQFFGGYFHEDWDLDAEDDAGVVRFFKSLAPSERVLEVRRQLEAFLSLGLPEEETQKAVWHSFGCAYDPGELPMRSWLQRIRRELARR
jgi:hypothetical protein